jgi:5-methylcytosine-specific restriction endonuclease McrBC regulatory subunit McrC
MFVKHQCPHHATLKRTIHLIIQLISNDQNHQIISSLVSAVDKIDTDQTPTPNNLKIKRGHLFSEIKVSNV